MPTRKIAIPTFRYRGGKAQLASEIVKYIPKRGRRFFDLFGGRGNVTYHAIAEGFEYEEWVLNDINTAPFFRATRDLGDQFKASEKSKAEFDRLTELAKHGDPHALLMEPYLAYNGGTYGGGGFTTEGGRRTPESYESNVHLACKLLREKNVRITALDWLDCLEAEQLGPDDFVMVDAPYIGCDVGAYSAESICPTELIEYLKSASFNWVFTEYRQPLYVVAFGEPVYQKEQAGRVECIWTNVGTRGANRDSVTVPFESVPNDQKDTYYVGLPQEDLLREIRECIAVITAARNQMNQEIRKRLLPALLELRKRTIRKHPGYYETLAAMGLNADTVRQWFYRSHSADEVIDLMEEEEAQPQIRERDDRDPHDTEGLLLEHADKMAKALLENKITHAKRLAAEYVRARDENRE